MTAHEEAVRAAVEAVRRMVPPWDRRLCAEAAVDAAEPILLAAERARIAAAIRDPFPPIAPGEFIGREFAASIAETAPEETP